MIFTVGSVVQLIGGSIPITVVASPSEESPHLLTCVWFNLNEGPDYGFNYVDLPSGALVEVKMQS